MIREETHKNGYIGKCPHAEKRIPEFLSRDRDKMAEDRAFGLLPD